MANRITQEFNTILRDVGSIYDYYTKQHITGQNTNITKFECNILELSDVDMFYRISGYDLFEDKEHNYKSVMDVAKNLLSTISASNRQLVFSIYGTNRKTQLYYGSNFSVAHQIKNTLSGNMFSASVSNEWIAPDKLRRIQAYNGFISGLSKIEPGTIDKIINNLQHNDFLINIVAMPVPQEMVRNELVTINSHRDRLQRVSKTELIIGSNRSRHFDNDNHDVLETIELLEKEEQRLKRGIIGGLWHIAVHLSAPNLESYKEVSSTVISAFRNNCTNDKDSTTPIVINTDFAAVAKSIWTLPQTASIEQKKAIGLYSTELLNLADLDTLSSIITLPIYPHNGFHVRHLGESAASTGAFDRFAPDIESDDAFELGTLNDGSKYMLPISSFRQHAFITGATQFGKSTTVKETLIEAKQQGLSFVVLEAAKKEYWNLVKTNEMKDIPVYSVGGDAKDLYINPFQPEDGTRLEFHIQSLINALLAMFVQDDPLPQILTNLIYLVYERRGWDTTQRVNAESNRQKDYPILSDMLEHLDESVSSIGYSDDVRDDMKGVVKVRITSLLRQVGKFFNTQRNISMKDMFATSAIIELDDFDDVSKPFIASILAMKANEYSKQCTAENKLRRLLVVEEAHHIIPNPDLKSATPNSLRCSSYFSDMLAEVSSYGTGIIIVDQRASAISPAALANTGVKIVHNIRQGDDINAISSSMGLKAHEWGLLNKFKIGEAIITIPQSPEICCVHIKKTKDNMNDTHIACLFCENKDCLSKECLAEQLDVNFKGNPLIIRQKIYDYLSSVQKNEGSESNGN